MEDEEGVNDRREDRGGREDSLIVAYRGVLFEERDSAMHR